MDYLESAHQVFDIEIQGMQKVKSSMDSSFNKIIDVILNSSGRCVVTGMGKSGLVGKKIAATLASTGTRAFFIHPGEAYHGDLGMIHSNDVIIAISNSGETDEVIKLLSFFKDNKNTVISLTGNRESTLGRYGDFFLDISVEKEACLLELAPTTSTTVTMAMGDAIAVSLMKARNFQPESFARFHPGGSLGRKLLTKVSDVMSKNDLPIVSPEDGFEKIIDAMTRGRLGLAIVSKNGKSVDGIISDGDLRRAITKYSDKIINTKASDFCTKEAKTILEEERIAMAETYMQEQKISNLIVVNKENNIRGVLQIYNL